ncbi:ABC transporter permease [Dietzia aurantiaca]|uniref:ABC transporter permease n=1 Tax=Dietzia aurantiaca TaxID=983873 RepID=UPI001E4DDF79|nr:ABC transporter permease [Dietzia aurantiaca]
MTTTDQFPFPSDTATDSGAGAGVGTGAAAPETQSAWRIVAGREIMVKLRDKNFIISTLTTLAIMVVAFAVSFFVGGQTESKTLAVASPEAVAVAEQATTDEGAAMSGPFAPGDLEVTISEYPDVAAAEQAVSEGDADAALIGAPGEWTLVGTDSVDSSLAGLIGATVAADALETNAAAAGTTVGDLTAGSEVGERLLDPDGAADEGVQFIAGFVFVFLFYLAAILFGYAIANSVVEEKQSRIVEILAAAIPLRQLLVGKVVGATVLAMGQMVLFVGIGLIGLSFTEYTALLPAMAGAAAWYLALFVIGFVALACLFAVAGALATRAEDVQSTSSPVLTLIMIATFGGLFVSGTWQVVASYIPIMSTVTMPIRLVEGTAAWWEPIVAMIVSLVAAALVIGVAERIYRRSIMQTGRKLTYREALKLSD